MTKPLTAIITDGFKRFSDAELEEHYYKVITELRAATTAVIDFRWKEWFDIWALIQLLFILDDEDIRVKRRIIRLLSPNAISEDQKNEELKRFALAHLRFLSDMEFLDRADELGVELWIQHTPDRQALMRATPSALRQITAEIIEPDSAQENHRPIIPITRLSDLNLKEKRDRLYQRTEEIFGEFFGESIVQQAGLGDCLLSELVINVSHHGGGKGYVALRAGRGLRRVKRESPQDYERRRRARINHPLTDWREYFQRYPDDGYFELVVADRGEGIARSILEDARVPSELKMRPNSLEKSHMLLQYALLPDTSRLSSEERRLKDLTDFTGLAAVGFVLAEHEGSLLIRERKSRHIFGTAIGGEGRASELLTLKKKEPRQLNTIPGVSVTAVIPMQGWHLELPGFPPLPETDTSEQPDPSTLQGIAVFRVNPSDTTFLDQRFGMSWSDIAKSVKSLSTTTNVILIDVLASSVDKDELWTGLTKVRRACKAQGLALILGGVERRLAYRLEEYAALDRRKISGKQDWILFGFGDDHRVYCFGEFGKDPEHKHALAQNLVNSFHRGHIIAGAREDLLNEANYLKHKASPFEADEETEDIDLLELRVSISQVQEKLHGLYARSLEEEIKQSSAWLPNQTVLLTGGDKVADYLCIHSMIQMRELYPDISRLLLSMVNTLDFDFILSVGVTSHSVAKDVWKAALQRRIHQGERGSPINFYAYHDYFGFDHGETSKPIIERGAKVLVLVDGVRKGDHCREVIEHVEDCEASVVAIYSLFDLRDQDESKIIHGIPLHCILKVPVKQADADAPPHYFENPYTYSLSLAGAAEPLDDNEWSVALTKRQAYRYIEGYGLILRGHKTFYDQHFMRTISLPYLLNSSTALNAELIHNTLTLIENEEVDCIVYPEQSSISILVSSLIAKPGVREQVSTVMCRRAVWPDRASGYELDLVGRETLNASRNVLILEDEVYTGSSIKNLADLCLTYHGGILQKMLVMTIIDSMMKAERAALTRLLKQTALERSDDSSGGTLDVRFFAFMQFSLCTYWKEPSCPLCRQRQQFERLKTRMMGFIERGYARDRSVELTPQPIDQNYRARNSLHVFEDGAEFTRPSLPEPVFVTTFEGLEVLCEEAYVEGDLNWLVERIRPNHPQLFPPDVLLAVIELLSRDMALLLRVRLRNQMLEHVRYLLIGRHLQGIHLARLMEIFSDWPLHCLKHVWEDLWETIFSKTDSIDRFMESYPGAELLLTAVESRPDHPLKNKLLVVFDEFLGRLVTEVVPNDIASRKRVQMAMCLRRSAYRYRPTHKNLGTLVADITFLAAYFELEDTSESHLILRRGLINLKRCNDGDNSRAYIDAVQMASHLLYSIELLPVYDPAAMLRINGLPDYLRLKESIESIQNVYPHRGPIRECEKIEAYAAEIEEILYQENSPLRKALSEYLEDYRRSLEEALSPVQQWAIKDHAELHILPLGVDLSALYIVLNSAAVSSVFGELAINLGRAQSRWDQRQPPIKSLTDDRQPFHVEIVIEQNRDMIIITLTNPCTEGEYLEMKNWKGIGMGQMKSALDSLGHSYDLHFIADKDTLVQTFSLRRIHK